MLSLSGIYSHQKGSWDMQSNCGQKAHCCLSHILMKRSPEFICKCLRIKGQDKQKFLPGFCSTSLVQVPVMQTTHVAVHESTPKFELDLTHTEVLPMTWLLSLQLHWQPEQPKSSPKTRFIKHSIFHVSGKISREGLLLKEEES